jgi:transposase
MWTPTTRQQHSRPVKRYQTDLTDSEWHVIAPHLPRPCATGRPREWPMREILNGIFYVVRAGCPWRLLPNDLPPWGTIYRWFAAWRDDGRFERINHALVMADRERVGRDSSPSAHSEFARKTAEERAQAEKLGMEQRQAAARAVAQANYETCLNRASTKYDINWSANCKGLAERNQKNRATCNLGPSSCDNIYPVRDASPNCALPRDLSRSLKADLDRDQDRCLQESHAGLQ